MGHRRRAREYAVQALFQIDLTGGTVADALPALWSDREVDPSVRNFAETLVHGVVDDRDELDRWIVSAAANWRIDRMAVVDRNVLRLAVYEMLNESDTPAAVVIDEAIDIGGRFGSERSGAFINGVLDSVHRSIERGDLPARDEGEATTP